MRITLSQNEMKEIVKAGVDRTLLSPGASVGWDVANVDTVGEDGFSITLRETGDDERE